MLPGDPRPEGSGRGSGDLYTGPSQAAPGQSATATPSLAMLLPLVVLLALTFSPAEPASIRNSSLELVDETLPVRNTTQRRWISQIMAEVLPTFYPSSSTNEECRKQGTLYRDNLANLTLWAVQMLDSSALSEIGLLSGNEFNSGSFDQCIRLNVPEYNIRGKHCFANLRISPTYFNIEEKQGILEYKNLSPMTSVWNKIRRVNDDRIKKRDTLYWAICIPSGCTHTDLQESLSKVIIPAFKENGIDVELSVEDTDCEVGNFEVNWTPGTYAYLIVLGAFVLITLIATGVHYLFYESYAEEKEDSSVLLKFSIISNSQRLLKPESRPELKFLSGVKVISMFLIIYGHRMLIGMYWPMFHVEDQEKMFDSFLEVINLNGPIIVNTFLLTTGFLIFNKLLTDIRKNRDINLPIYIFYRWARATPVYVAVLCTVIFMKPLLMNEPLYKREAQWRIDNCRQYFWSHIFYINNYYKPEAECLLPAWYLAVDMQLYIVCVTTGFIMSKSKKCGYVLLGFLLGAAVAVPGVVTYFQGFDATLRFYLNFLDHYYNHPEYVDSYIPTHMRATPYVMGMLTAVILMKLKKRNYKFSSLQWWLGVIVSTVLGLGSLVYAYIFYIPGRETSLFENGLYVSIHRVTWSLCITWIILSGVLNGYGRVSLFLGASIYTPLNKLTLNALLIHSLFQAQTFMSQRQPEYTTLYTTIWKSSGDLLITYTLSYILHLIVEAPLSRLQDQALRKLLGKKTGK